METNSVEWINVVCDWLRNSSAEHAADDIAGWLEQASPQDLQPLVDVLGEQVRNLERSPRRWRLLMQLLAARSGRVAVARQSDGEVSAMESISELAPESLIELFQGLGEIDSQAAAHTLQILAAQGDEESIQVLASAMADSPPGVWQHAALALSPLWRASSEQLELFFDRLQYHDPSPITLAVLLDLANFAVSKGRLREHPWLAKVPQLETLLLRLVGQLKKLQDNPGSFGGQVEEVQRILADSVALCISLCHALGGIGRETSLEALGSALGLSHRRIQVEAAFNMTLLGSDKGKRHLIGLARDPVARYRAIAFAEELEIVDEIDEEWREPWRLAESELCSWLAEPDKFGVPPAEIELVDSRTLFWPSYVEPRNCYLFRFTYRFADQTLSNIGIAGPTVHAFQSKLLGLPHDDIYAAFAGWDVEHEEIYALPMQMLTPVQRQEADRQIAFFEAAGFEKIEPHSLTFMLGEVALLARLAKEGSSYWGVTNQQESVVLPTSSQSDSLSDQVVLGIYRGRKILRSFND